MKKKSRCFYLSFLLLLIGYTAYPQWQNHLWTGKQANNWYFYFYTGLNFDTSPPTQIMDSMVDDWFLESGSGFEGSGSISDSDGNVLFYTNGDAIWNSNNELMENGYYLLGETSATQTGLIIPVPGSAERYYVFSVDGTPDPEPVLAYSEVDMTLNGGLGDVTENKNIVLSDIMGEKLSAVHHANGEDVWVVAHTGSLDLPGNTFKAFLVTADGVSEAVETSIGDEVGWSLGQMKISPDGKKIAVVNGAGGISVFLQVFDFDNQTGILSNPVTLTSAIDLSPMEFMYGLEFSPNSRFLYFSEINFQDPGKLHQLDLNAGSEADIVASDVVLSQATTIGNPYYFMSIQVGPDGKIYLIKQEYGTTISVINNPNNKGVDANFQDLDIQFFGGLGDGLPGFIQSYFESGILYEGGSCPNQDVTFSTIRIPDIESIAWNFGDPDSGADNTSADLEPLHAFSSPGTYLVSAVIISNGAEQTTVTEVVITAPDAFIPSTSMTTLCADNTGNATFNLESLTLEILSEQDEVIVTVAYYANEEDMAADSPIATPASFTTTGQIIYAKVTNSDTGCSAVINFELTVNPFPFATAPVVASQCAGIDGTAIFDLPLEDAEILGTQNPNDYTVVYYASETDFDNDIPIGTPENFETSGQTVYALITNSTTSCTSSVSFELAVTTLPIADDPADVFACDSYQLPALNANNSYRTGSGGTGEELSVNSVITETTLLYVVAQSMDNPDCTSENMLAITITPTPSFNLGGPYAACSASGITVAVDAENFDFAEAIYAWTINGEVVSEDSPEITATEFGTYEVTVTVNGCSSTRSVEVVFDDLVIDVDFEAGCNGTAYWLAAVPVDDSFNPDTATYLWSGPEFTSAEREFEVPAAGIYTVTVTTEDGCTGEKFYEVTGTTCEVPKGISPNGDTRNDTFDLSDYNVKKLSIFDRYGQQVYSKKNYVNEWAGQSENGNELPSGTYYYMIERQNGESTTGWVYINREE